MKQPKKLTLKQKKAVEASGYNPESWMLEEEKEFYLKIIHNVLGIRLTIDRYALPKKGGKKRNDKLRSSDDSGLP